MGMTPIEYAKSRGISHQAVYKALREGRLRKLPDGTIAPASATVDEATSAVHREPVATTQGGSVPQSTSMAQAKLAGEVIKVRRAKLYYLRGRVGKAAKVKDLIKKKVVHAAELPENKAD